jgi:hypothetical protein
MTPAPARRTHARSTIAPRGPRRVSGPVSRRMVAAPAGAGALPRRGSTGLFARVRALPEHRVVDRLLRSRLWIWALGALLGGIVTMQVSLLKLNSGISRAVETTTTLERQNADIEAAIARLSSPDRIATGAQTLGMDMPAAGAVSYLRPGPRDAQRAVQRMEPPSEAAAALLANGGVEPGSLAAPPVTAPIDPAAATTSETAPATNTTTPATTEPPPTATPVPVTTPAPAAQQPPAQGEAGGERSETDAQASPAGGAVAGQG